jgi:hypothetical protein
MSLGWFDSSDWVLPALTLGIIYSAYIARLTRGSLRETLAQEFIRTARAKGSSETSVVFLHAMKLASLPVLNFLGPAAAGLLTGSFIVETIFQLPGLGQFFIAAATNGDISSRLPSPPSTPRSSSASTCSWTSSRLAQPAHPAPSMSSTPQQSFPRCVPPGVGSCGSV